MKHNISFIYEVLRNNIVYKTLKAQDGGQIMCNADASIKRSISCTLEIPADVDFLKDELKVSFVLDGIKIPLGIFNITTMPSKVDENGRKTHDCEGYDRTYKLYQHKIEKRSEAYFKAGRRYTDVIKELLVKAEIIDYIIADSNLTLSVDREEFEVGTNYLTIINTLLNEINYTAVWFDSNGYARADLYESPVNRAVTFSYHSGRDSIIMRSHEAENDSFESYNVFTVGISNAEQTIYKTSVNDDITSKLSTVNRGRIPAPVVMLDSTADEATAQQYADNLKFKSMISTETVKVKTAIDKQHELYEIVEVDLPEIKGKFEEVGYSITLNTSALMNHTLRRAVYL